MKCYIRVSDTAYWSLHYENVFFLFIFFLQYELIYQVLGRSNFNKITANLDLFLRRFNEVQYWVVTEMVLAQNVGKRVQLLRKFIKVAAQYVHFSHYCICIQELRVLYKKSTTQDKLINEVYIVKRNVWHLFLFIPAAKNSRIYILFSPL